LFLEKWWPIEYLKKKKKIKVKVNFYKEKSKIKYILFFFFINYNNKCSLIILKIFVLNKYERFNQKFLLNYKR
jgi:hypothetical protein